MPGGALVPGGFWGLGTAAGGTGIFLALYFSLLKVRKPVPKQVSSSDSLSDDKQLRKRGFS